MRFQVIRRINEARMSSPVVPSALVVAGASAGGVEALRALVAGLPVDLDAAVLVVLHVPRDGSSALPAILSRGGPLPAGHAVDGEPLTRGRVLVAPADHYLIVSDGRIRLSRGRPRTGTGRRSIRCSGRPPGRGGSGRSPSCCRAPATTGRRAPRPSPTWAER
jgi:chemotaxis response regulator CheB